MPVPWDQANHSPHPGTHPTDTAEDTIRRVESIVQSVTHRDTSQVEVPPAPRRMPAICPIDCEVEASRKPTDT